MALFFSTTGFGVRCYLLILLVILSKTCDPHTYRRVVVKKTTLESSIPDIEPHQAHPTSSIDVYATNRLIDFSSHPSTIHPPPIRNTALLSGRSSGRRDVPRANSTRIRRGPGHRGLAVARL